VSETAARQEKAVPAAALRLNLRRITVLQLKDPPSPLFWTACRPPDDARIRTGPPVTGSL
jgi:hypothetical protein